MKMIHTASWNHTRRTCGSS